MSEPGRSNVLLRAYRFLMPREARFIEYFCDHSRLIVTAAESFRALMSGDGEADRHVAEINRLENAADEVTRGPPCSPSTAPSSPRSTVRRSST